MYEFLIFEYNQHKLLAVDETQSCAFFIIKKISKSQCLGLFTFYLIDIAHTLLSSLIVPNVAEQ